MGRVYGQKIALIKLLLITMWRRGVTKLLPKLGFTLGKYSSLGLIA